jgi:hypothetical protein
MVSITPPGSFCRTLDSRSAHHTGPFPFSMPQLERSSPLALPVMRTSLAFHTVIKAL